MSKTFSGASIRMKNIVPRSYQNELPKADPRVIKKAKLNIIVGLAFISCAAIFASIQVNSSQMVGASSKLNLNLGNGNQLEIDRKGIKALDV